MATVGRIVAALASGTQETSLSLAQINFDFSLVKLDAPASFNGVGSLLSRKRKVAAESGSSHVTARKLGALFESLLPDTPLLIDRYGSRASEITELSENEEASRPIYGMFADQAGVDATSIWAAATSGPAAIAVHLLACMLARMFPGPEATSIWSELLEERKKELASEDDTKPCHISTLLAAHISIPRDLLAEWDNSARSWLRVADEAKSIQQSQLLLIFKNVHVPVNKERGNLYRSVTAAWVKALELMENLLRGAAQCVTPYQGNGDLLLALASWHLYPDMDVLGSTKILQKDPLLPREAILTVGLECSPVQQDVGVYWSLPLSHFRFYGPPKQAAHSLCTDAERVPFHHFRFVVLGSFLSNWASLCGPNFEVVDQAKTIIRIYDYLITKPEMKTPQELDSNKRSSYYLLSESLKTRKNWLRDLSEICRSFVDSDNPEKAVYKRLIGLGTRRGSRFVGKQPRLFGLTRFKDFFDLLGGTEAKIAALRRVSSRTDLKDMHSLIRYRNPEYNVNGERVERRLGMNAEQEVCPLMEIPTSPALAVPAHPNNNDGYTAFDPDAEHNRKRPRQHSEEAGSRQQSSDAWISETAEGETWPLGENGCSWSSPAIDQILPLQGNDTNQSFDTESDPDVSSAVNSLMFDGVSRFLPDRYFIYASLPSAGIISRKRSLEADEVRHQPHNRWAVESQCNDLSHALPNEDILDTKELQIQYSGDRLICMGPLGQEQLNLHFGDAKEIALFSWNPSLKLTTTPDDIAWALDSGAFNRNELAAFLSTGRLRWQKFDAEDVHNANRGMNENDGDNNESEDDDDYEDDYDDEDYDEELEDYEDQVRHYEHSESQCHFRRALAIVLDIYAQFPKATIALKVVEKPLSQQRWAMLYKPSSIRLPDFISEGEWSEKGIDQRMFGFFPYSLARRQYFALLATFETGTLNPRPSSLDKVMAMCSGDSLFVAAHLLVDPFESRYLKGSSICRIRGNIGRPGITMMVPPPDLQVKKQNSADWTLVNHDSFDGEVFDSFGGTSLHLSFTEYNRPVNTGIHGVRDAEMYFVEAYVQVHFRGRWIGDIDIISGLESGHFDTYDISDSRRWWALDTSQVACMHTAKHIRKNRLIAVDNWDEFIDIPKDGTIVRAKDNWMARLAAASLSVQRKNRTIVLKSSDSLCWPCIECYCLGESSVRGTTLIV